MSAAIEEKIPDRIEGTAGLGVGPGMSTTTQPTIEVNVAAQGMVHESDLPEIEKRVNRINAQARKLGVPPVTYRLTGKEDLRPVNHKRAEDGSGWVPTEVDRYVEVQVIGEQPKLPGGWRLAAVVDYRQSVPLVSMVPGEALPIDPRGYGARCDHCGTARQRADVFVLVNDAGEGRQVGRQCLADFLGAAANDPVAALNLFAKLSGLLGFDEEHVGSREPSGFYLEQIMVLAGAIVNVSGWVSRARAEADPRLAATSQRINEYLYPPKFAYPCKASAEYAEWRAQVHEELKQHDALVAEARAARAWAQSRTGSEFELELADIAKCDWLQSKYLGRAAYILPGFRKEQDRLKEAARTKSRWAASEHVGKVGERIELELELVSTKQIDGHFGTTTLAIFDDGRGNQLKWFASNFPKWDVNTKMSVKATVKAHDAYQGTKQTLLTRVR